MKRFNVTYHLSNGEAMYGGSVSAASTKEATNLVAKTLPGGDPYLIVADGDYTGTAILKSAIVAITVANNIE